MLVYLLFIKSDEDKSLFEEIFYKFRKQMIYYAFGFVSNEIDAEDIVHDVFLKIAQKKFSSFKENQKRNRYPQLLIKGNKEHCFKFDKSKKQRSFNR